jgi:RimJ/RimL family protein N-acetyltransferase
VTEAGAGFALTHAYETERLRLRPFSADDFEAVYVMQSEPDITRYLYWDPRTRSEARAALEVKIASTAIRAEGEWVFLAAELKETGELVVDTVLKWLSAEHRTAEIGFIAHPAHHGRGYTTEAGRELLQIAFEELGSHRVVGHTEARNVASARVMEKLGMRREAYLVENEWVKGEWQSELIYAILDREWRAGRG